MPTTRLSTGGVASDANLNGPEVGPDRSRLLAAGPFVGAKRCQCGDDLGKQRVHRLQNGAQSWVALSTQRLCFLLTEIEHARQTRPGFGVLHAPSLCTPSQAPCHHRLDVVHPVVDYRSPLGRERCAVLHVVLGVRFVTHLVERCSFRLLSRIALVVSPHKGFGTGGSHREDRKSERVSRRPVCGCTVDIRLRLSKRIELAEEKSHMLV